MLVNSRFLALLNQLKGHVLSMARLLVPAHRLQVLGMIPRTFRQRRLFIPSRRTLWALIYAVERAQLFYRLATLHFRRVWHVLGSQRVRRADSGRVAPLTRVNVADEARLKHF